MECLWKAKPWSGDYRNTKESDCKKRITSRVWGRREAGICATETVTTLLIGYTPTWNKRSKNKKQEEWCPATVCPYEKKKNSLQIEGKTFHLLCHCSPEAAVLPSRWIVISAHQVLPECWFLSLDVSLTQFCVVLSKKNWFARKSFRIFNSLLFKPLVCPGYAFL